MIINAMTSLKVGPLHDEWVFYGISGTYDTITGCCEAIMAIILFIPRFTNTTTEIANNPHWRHDLKSRKCENVKIVLVWFGIKKGCVLERIYTSIL